MSEFTPLSELEGYNSDRLSWRLVLPEYVPTEKIGINVQRIERLARIAGLEHLRIDSYQGDTTEYQASIIGGDAQGNAVAGATAVETKADLEKTELSQPSAIKNLYYEYGWADGKVSINSAELTDRILNNKKSDGVLRNGQNWTPLLDNAIKTGIRTNAKEQLVYNVPNIRAFMFYWNTAFGLLLATSSDHISALNIAADISIMHITHNLGNHVMANSEGLKMKDRRLSLFAGYQFDRLAVVQGLSRATKLVKNLKD